VPAERECIFCRIARREAPGRLAYEDERVVAFDDIHPKAPVHVLIVPRRHIPTLLDLAEEDRELAGHLLLVANRLARQRGIDASGFRVITNCNADGGQVVFHLHLHLLGGRPLRWVPA
jgi:histidine triad (HIT) family protein